MFLARVKIITSFIIVSILSGCGATPGDNCLKYSKYKCSEIEKAKYNVYFYYPDEREKYLGEANGLQACSAVAGNYSELTHSPKLWVCCMKTSKSQCEEKHR
jgi:hypothetical protein